MTSYKAFGLSIAANGPVPGLVPQASDSQACDTRVWLDSAPPRAATGSLDGDPWFVSGASGGDPDGPAVRVWKVASGAYFRMLYRDGTEFFVEREGREVWVTWPDSSTLEDTATYLLGPVIGFVLRLRGIACLHASAVVVGDRAVAVMGPPSAGKSTLAAAFCRMGVPVLADDIVALAERRDEVLVLPAYPQLRLWPDSVAALYGAADALPRLTPSWDKRRLDLTRDGCRFQRDPLPLAAIYLLAGRSTGAAPSTEILRGRDALLALLGNTYASHLLDATMRGHEFTSLARLASTVHVRRVIGSTDAANVTQLCRRILSEMSR